MCLDLHTDVFRSLCLRNGPRGFSGRVKLSLRTASSYWPSCMLSSKRQLGLRGNLVLHKFQHHTLGTVGVVATLSVSVAQWVISVKLREDETGGQTLAHPAAVVRKGCLFW